LELAQLAHQDKVLTAARLQFQVLLKAAVADRLLMVSV
jgi:hypothetical protein